MVHKMVLESGVLLVGYYRYLKNLKEKIDNVRSLSLVFLWKTWF